MKTMIKKMLCGVLVAAFFCASISAVRVKPVKPPIQLMGEVVCEGVSSDVIPSFLIYFAGMRIASDENGLYRLSIEDEDKSLLDDFSLMICKRFEPEHERGNTIAGMKVKKLGKCIWYKLDREWDARAKKYYWLISEREVTDTDVIPDKCLILSLSSQYVDRVENIEFSPSGIVALPRVVLRADADQLARCSVKSAIEGIGSRALCDRKHVMTKEQNGVHIALAQ
jgi:hypothetical protein